MFIDRDGKEVDAAFVPDGQRLFEFYRVRVIRDTHDLDGKRIKREVIAEEDFQEYPTTEQKMYCLAKHQGDFASTERIAVLDWLPFTEKSEEECGCCDGNCYCCATARKFDAIEMEYYDRKLQESTDDGVEDDIPY